MRFHQKLSGYSVKRKCRHPDVTPATGHTGGCRETSSSEASEEPRQNDKTFVSVTCVNAENRKKKKENREDYDGHLCYDEKRNTTSAYETFFKKVIIKFLILTSETCSYIRQNL